MQVSSRSWLLAVVSVVALAGCEQGRADAAPPPGGGPGKGGPDQPTRVQVVRAEAGNMTSSFRFLGRVEPALEAGLASAVAGHVQEVRARVGDHVKRNQLLLVIEPYTVRALLAAARAKVKGTEAELAQARRQYDRVKDLGEPTISDPEREGFAMAVDVLEARLEEERAEVMEMVIAMAAFTLEAPFDAVVRERRVDPGDWIERGQAVMDLVSTEELEVHVDVSPEVGAQLAVGQDATLVGPQELPARIEGIVPALDLDTRTMRVRLSPVLVGDGARPAWLLAGRALDVAFDVSLEGEGVLLPRDALLRGALETRVMMVRDGRSHPVAVEVIAQAGESSLVRGEGLSAGSSVIVRGNERLAPGQPVEVVE
jgi:RND family efflux transporter MFP subunit